MLNQGWSETGLKWDEILLEYFVVFVIMWCDEVKWREKREADFFFFSLNGRRKENNWFFHGAHMNHLITHEEDELIFLIYW